VEVQDHAAPSWQASILRQAAATSSSSFASTARDLGSAIASQRPSCGLVVSRSTDCHRAAGTGSIAGHQCRTSPAKRQGTL